jgi:hypothetical protein
MSSVRQIPVPDEASALSTLSRIDYADAFVAPTHSVNDQTAEQWLRAVLETAPASARATLVSGWSALGLKLGSGGILGWTVRQSEADHVLVGAESRIGMPAELLLMRQQDTILFCTFVQHANAAARALWAGVEPVHLPIVRRVLAQGVERAKAAVAGSSS